MCNHPLHTAHNQTPHQLWVLRMAQARMETPQTVTETFSPFFENMNPFQNINRLNEK